MLAFPRELMALRPVLEFPGGANPEARRSLYVDVISRAEPQRTEGALHADGSRIRTDKLRPRGALITDARFVRSVVAARFTASDHRIRSRTSVYVFGDEV